MVGFFCAEFSLIFCVQIISIMADWLGNIVRDDTRLIR